MGRDFEDSGKPDSTGADALPSSRRDAIDLNNEIADRDTGRNKRFLSGSSSEQIEREKKRNEERMSALMRAMQDPAYAALYGRAKNTVDEVQRAVDLAREKLERESAIAADALSRLQSAAAKLPDGTRVYRSERDGRLYAEDGGDVTDQAALATGLSQNSPSWEQHEQAQAEVDKREQQLQELDTYQQEVLNPTREKLEDEDHPASEEELTTIIKQMKDTAPISAREFISSDDMPTVKVSVGSAADEFLGSAELNTPPLNEHFAAARDAAPEAAPATPAPDASPKLA